MSSSPSLPPHLPLQGQGNISLLELAGAGFLVTVAAIIASATENVGTLLVLILVAMWLVFIVTHGVSFAPLLRGAFPQYYG